MTEIIECDYELIEGGLAVSGSLLNAFTAGIKIILELGRSLGSALRRGSNGKLCKI